MLEKFEQSQIKDYAKDGTNIAISVSDYFTNMLDQSMDWKAAEEICQYWGKPFALKGIMSVDDAKRAVDIGAAAIMISNHGGRHLDGSRAPFEQGLASETDLLRAQWLAQIRVVQNGAER